MRWHNAVWTRWSLSFVAGSLAVVTQLPAQTVTFLGYETSVPSGWSARTPTSSMRLAEYTTPSRGDSDGAEVIVYFFGVGQGGSVDANLARWKNQFSNPDGAPVMARVVRDSTGAFRLTIASYHGTYARGIGAGSTPEKARPNHGLIAVVAETPKGTLFFQMFGPIASVEAQRDTYLAFIKGMK